MKLSRTAILATLGFCTAALFLNGCGKPAPEPQPEPKPAPPPPPTTSPSAPKETLVSAEENSFHEVTAHLDPGGSFYLYVGTEQWLEGLSGKVSDWRQFASIIPDVSDENRANIDKAINVLTRLTKGSGIEDVSGLGLSGIAREPGLYRTKAILHHYPGRGSGFLWSAFGQEPHPLDAQNLLPATTAFATFSDLDLPLLWSAFEKELAQSGFPEAETWLRSLPQTFEQGTGMNWQQLLGSLGGEYGLALTLDEAKMISVPIPAAQPLMIPEPGILLAFKVKDDLIFDRLEQMTKANQQMIRVDEDGLKMRTMVIPLPLPIAVRPSWARSGDYLLFASTDALILEAMAVQRGKKPGLKSTDEFKRLAQDTPERGNNFVFLSQRFGETVNQLQQQALAASGQLKGSSSPGNPGPAWDQMQKLLGSDAAVTYTVSAKMEEGWLSVGNGNQHPAKAIFATAAVPMIGFMAAIAIPNFVKARATAQKNSCIANLKQLDGATQQWALENRKPANAPVRAEDLTRYLRGEKLPVCPQGGTYTFGTVTDDPKCSIPGHAL